MKPIGNITPTSRYFLAPMEAVNCASFRVLCKRRGAGLIYTDMIDADKFIEYAKEFSNEDAIKVIANPQPEEQPLVIQLGGRNLDNLKQTMDILLPYAKIFDINLGCPLGYMLGKKGGCYLQKHVDQLRPWLKELRAHCKIPLTIKIRAGWDKSSINAIEVSKIAEQVGIDAIAIHPRTRKQRYQENADWFLVKRIKQVVKIPVILSGDVTNLDSSIKATNKTGADYIMIARAAKNNPSIFEQLNNPKKYKTIPGKLRTYNKYQIDPIQDFKDWLKLYNGLETRHKISEIQDHALWTSSECVGHKEIVQEIKAADTEEQILKLVSGLTY